MLFSFLVLNKRFADHFFTVPLVAVLLASLSMGTFIFFINHAVAWLQVNKMTYEMKKESMSIVKGSLQNEIDPYKVKDTAPLKEYVERLTKREGKQISSNRSGYIQLIDFVEIMEEAKKMTSSSNWNIPLEIMFLAPPPFFHTGRKKMRRLTYPNIWHFSALENGRRKCRTWSLALINWLRLPSVL